MRLVYTATQQPVAIGDRVTVDGFELVVDYFAKPHKPDSSGKVSLRVPGNTDVCGGPEYYVSIIGAEWIEREDRANLPPVTITNSARESAIASVMENMECDRPDAEKIVDGDKVVIGGNWFCLDDSGSLCGGPVNADGTLDYELFSLIDMPDLFEHAELCAKAHAMLTAGKTAA